MDESIRTVTVRFASRYERKESRMKKIGFIGAGIMGKSMIRNLMKHGYEVHLYARTPRKAADLAAEGVILHESIAQCVTASEALISIVGYPSDVEEIYLGEDGILAHAKAGMLLIDMTTSSPKLAQTLYEHGKVRRVNVLDAPVTGGDVGARNGTLTILVGGEQTAFEQALPLFQAMGEHIYYCGAAGSGQHIKLANQIMIAGTLSGVSEAIAYTKKKGLDPDRLIAFLKDGAAGSRQLELLGPKMIAGDFAPGFFIKHFIKDMRIAQKEAREVKLRLRVLDTVLANFEELAEKGMEEDGTQRLLTLYLPQ